MPRFRFCYCGKNLENFNLCLDHKVVGFTRRVAGSGDTIYLAVTKDNGTWCSARGIAGEETDIKPWPDADRFKQCFRMESLEFCEPFSLSVLSGVGRFGAYPHLYYQGGRTLDDSTDKEVWDLLDKTFRSGGPTTTPNPSDSLPQKDFVEEETEETSDISEELMIGGTYQTIRFINETDPTRGLEPIVNDNFFGLFPQFREDYTILIDDNRLFPTCGPNTNSLDGKVPGLTGRPDAVLVHLHQTDKLSLQVNIVEYECFGESKVRLSQKNNYMNKHIIPQLMTFASAFSLNTDTQTRANTIQQWTDKIIHHIFTTDRQTEKVFPWIRDKMPGLPSERLGLILRDLLVDSFKENLRILLIIDELNAEHKEALTSIIGSFKLEKGKPAQFTSYVVRLSQRIILDSDKMEYALSFE